MKSRELAKLGIAQGRPRTLARQAIAAARDAGLPGAEIAALVRAVAAEPQSFLNHPIWGGLAGALTDGESLPESFAPRPAPAPFQVWGTDVDPASLAQMQNAVALPVAVRGAMMPDAHVGYGLPIGGVLAVANAVIPYAVGVDIACRMKMTVTDLPLPMLTERRDRLIRVLESETRFGLGAAFTAPRRHEVMDRDWSVSPVTRRLKDKAWSQLGTSGSGNHFVEYGVFTVGETPQARELALEPGQYLAILSHSGSRGTGAAVADYYSKVAMQLHPELPKELRHLAWLGLESAPGQEYWRAMQLMGHYAAANHACIHRHMVASLGAGVLLDLENHHNFAWREIYDGQEVIVHRKGATPAGMGVKGIIPGNMAAPAFVVRGLGNPASLNSAAHGAGRRMSRTAAKKAFTWPQLQKLLAERQVEVISAGLDEAPMAYKDIHEVMAAQADLVEILAQFRPRLVKMAPGHERAED